MVSDNFLFFLILQNENLAQNSEIFNKQAEIYSIFSYLGGDTDSSDVYLKILKDLIINTPKIQEKISRNVYLKILKDLIINTPKIQEKISQTKRRFLRLANFIDQCCIYFGLSFLIGIIEKLQYSMY